LEQSKWVCAKTDLTASDSQGGTPDGHGIFLKESYSYAFSICLFTPP